MSAPGSKKQEYLPSLRDAGGGIPQTPNKESWRFAMNTGITAKTGGNASISRKETRRGNGTRILRPLFI